MNMTLSKGDRTSQAIAEAAYSLFIEQGYHATSMRQIAQRAGVALSNIYNHFNSKEQIFDHLLLEKHPYRQVLAILQSAGGDTVEAFAHNAAHAIIAELGQRPDFLKMAFIELSEFRGMHAPHLFQTIFPQFMTLFQRFNDGPSRLRKLPPQVIMLAFLGMFFAYYLTDAAIPSDSQLRLDSSMLEHFLEIYLHGILEPE